MRYLAAVTIHTPKAVFYPGDALTLASSGLSRDALQELLDRGAIKIDRSAADKAAADKAAADKAAAENAAK